MPKLSLYANLLTSLLAAGCCMHHNNLQPTACSFLCELRKLTMAPPQGQIHFFSPQSVFPHYLSSISFVKERLIKITVGQQQREKKNSKLLHVWCWVGAVE